MNGNRVGDTMKVLDAEEVHAGLKRNIEMLHRLEGEMQNIEQTIKELTQMEESLKGHGGEALRGFYAECHLPFLQFFMTFKQSFTNILEQIGSALTSLEPDPSGFIEQDYLQVEVEQGINRARDTTVELTNETNAIMDEVSDIVSLPKLDDSEVIVGIVNAKKHRNQTVSNLLEFDQTQTNALTKVENDLFFMKNWILNVETLVKENLMDVDFPKEQWKEFARLHPLQVTLSYRTNALSGVEEMDVVGQTGVISGAFPYLNPGLFTVGTPLNLSTKLKLTPTFQYEVTTASCPKPAVVEEEVEENPVTKSLNSFKEIGQDIWDGLENRNEKKFDSFYDFGNYATVGSFDAVKSMYQGMEDRKDVAFDSTTDFVNYLTMGGVDLVKGAVNPEENFSKEHWLNSLGVASLLAGGAKPGISGTKNSVTHKVNEDIGKQNSTKDPVKSVTKGIEETAIKVEKEVVEWLDHTKNLAKDVWADVADGFTNLTDPKLATETNGNGMINSYIHFESNKAVGNVEDETKGTINGVAGAIGVKTLVGATEQFTNGRKNRLKPDIRYKTGEYEYFYETDSTGRIVKFETENLQLTKREDRLSHSRNTPGKIKGQDHAGHLAGDRFGGSPKIDNLVSQLSDVNLKQYKKIEDEWATALKEVPPKEVTVYVEIIYDENNMRPEKFIVNYTIDGEPGFEVIKN